MAAGTVKNSTFIKAIKYGVDKNAIKEIEVNLNDGKRKKAVVRISIDWDKHEAILQEVPSGIDGFQSKKNGVVTGTVFQQIISLLNEFKKARKLEFWWNIIWVSEGDLHDKACGIGRVKSDKEDLIAPISQQAVGRSLFHELLEEVNISFTIDDS